MLTHLQILVHIRAFAQSFCPSYKVPPREIAGGPFHISLTGLTERWVGESRSMQMHDGTQSSTILAKSFLLPFLIYHALFSFIKLHTRGPVSYICCSRIGRIPTLLVLKVMRENHKCSAAQSDPPPEKSIGIPISIESNILLKMKIFYRLFERKQYGAECDWTFPHLFIIETNDFGTPKNGPDRYDTMIWCNKIKAWWQIWCPTGGRT